MQGDDAFHAQGGPRLVAGRMAKPRDPFYPQFASPSVGTVQLPLQDNAPRTIHIYVSRSSPIAKPGKRASQITEVHLRKNNRHGVLELVVTPRDAPEIKPHPERQSQKTRIQISTVSLTSFMRLVDLFLLSLALVSSSVTGE